MNKSFTDEDRDGDGREVVDGHDDLRHVVRIVKADQLVAVGYLAVVKVQHQLHTHDHDWNKTIINTRHEEQNI
jgi:hypothetical protein